MIPRNITRGHVIKALEEIDASAIPLCRESAKFALVLNGKHYPPKYVLSLANRFANGKELDSSAFGGGQEKVNYRRRLTQMKRAMPLAPLSK